MKQTGLWRESKEEVFKYEIDKDIQYKMLRQIVYTLKTENGFIGIWFKVLQDATRFNDSLQDVSSDSLYGEKFIGPPNKVNTEFDNQSDGTAGKTQVVE